MSSSEIKREGDRGDEDWRSGEEEDLRKSRESWIKSRLVIQRYVRQILSKEAFHTSEETNQQGGGRERIRGKLQQLREDLCARLRDREQDESESMCGGTQLADPPDDRGGKNQKFKDQICEREARVQFSPLTAAKTRLPERATEGIKGCREGASAHQIFNTPTIKPSSMADQLQKNKAPVDQIEGVASNGKTVLGGRPMERGGPSQAQGVLCQPSVDQGTQTPQDVRYDAAGDAVTPVFPVHMKEQAAYVVGLDLSKQRAAMRSRWIAIGLFFSMQLFGVGGLFQELKNK